jgi:hypothetical protein
MQLVKLREALGVEEEVEVSIVGLEVQAAPSTTSHNIMVLPRHLSRRPLHPSTPSHHSELSRPWLL